jgi:hypothetical protein
MAFTWEINDVQGATELCWDETEIGDDGEQKYRLNPLTETLIFATMTVGIGTITDENWTEFYARLKMFEAIDGPFLRHGDGTAWLIIPADVENHIGLKTNASYKDKSRPAWFKDHVTITLDAYKRQAVRENRNR